MKTIFTLFFSVLIMSASAQNFTWTAQNSGTTEWLNDLCFVDDQTGWAVGDKGTIVATVDGGETWTAQISGTDRKLRSVFFLDQDTGWVAGGDSPLIVLYTVDGGNNWEALSAQAPGAAFLNEIQFASSTHGFGIALGDIYHTSDGGVNWNMGTYSPSVTTPWLNDLHVISDSTAFTAGRFTGSTSPTRPGVFDNIVNFEGLWTPHGAGYFDLDDELTAIHFTGEQRGFAGGKNGKIYTMEADGEIFPSVWYHNFTAPSGGWVWSIDFGGNDFGMFNTSIEEGPQVTTLIYHTTDGGDNWSSADSIEGLMFGKLVAVDTENVWIAGNAGQIYKGTPNVTSAFDHSAVEFSVMPNPFYSYVLIKSPEMYRDVQLNMFNYTGQLVESVYVGDFQYEYEFEGLDHLKSGVYFLQMKSADGSLNATQKVLKH